MIQALLNSTKEIGLMVAVLKPALDIGIVFKIIMLPALGWAASSVADAPYIGPH